MRFRIRIVEYGIPVHTMQDERLAIAFVASSHETGHQGSDDSNRFKDLGIVPLLLSLVWPNFNNPKELISTMGLQIRASNVLKRIH